MVRNDHYNFKYLGVKCHPAILQKVLTTLMGLDYEVQYKRVAENRVVIALCRQKEIVYGIRMQETGQLMTINTIIPLWIQEVTNNYEGDSQFLRC